MTPELWQRLKPLYAAALEAPEEERAQFIAEACGSDHGLRAALETLVAAGGDSSDSLDTPFVNLREFYPANTRAFSEGDLILGRFKVLRHLGSGGMGEVYEAEDQLLQGVHVALKTILPHIANDPAIRKYFEREVLLAREVAHSNLCPIYDIFHCEQPPPGFLFLTMKLLPGATLTMRLRETGPASAEEGLAILKQMTCGLAAIHSANIIHRDIKANNVILDGRGSDVRLWITDFGLARAYERETTLSGKLTLAGTPGYIAPELYLGHPPTKASDLFAFGVVLHEVFTGEKPAMAPDGSAHLVSPLLAPPRVSWFGVHLITECLSHDPKRRSQAFERALKIIDPEFDQHLPEDKPSKLWTRRRFIGVAATGISAAAAWAWWKWDELEELPHPLPQKRFVALLNWPQTANIQVAPMLTGVLSAIKTQLARVEAYDRDLFVITPGDAFQTIAATAHLKEVCDPLGANLVLAASGFPGAGYFQLFLRLLDPISGRALREKKLICALDDITSLPARAVHAAGSLLSVNRYMKSHEQVDPGTQSAAAFTAFQSAEALMNEPNDAGLDAATEKYKQAVELDPGYALAYARLAEAYVHSYGLRHDPGALELARGNSERALTLDPNLVDGHLARAILLEETGDEQGALRGLAKALALDPSNPETLRSQALVYTRLGRWSDAEQIYQRILNQRPNYWLTYTDKGYMLDRQGKYHEAIQAFRAAAVAAPLNSMALANLGSEYLQIGDFAAATDSLRKSIALKPNDLAAANTSLALRYQGKYSEALPFALKAVELNPSDDTYWLELGDCYSSLNNHKGDAKNAYLRAAAEAERHLSTDAADGPGWMLLALYQVKAGSPQNALLSIKKAEEIGADDMDSQLYKARILELAGKRDEALATLATCFRKGATAFQIAPFPDLQSLRKDPRYGEMLQSKSVPPKTVT